MHRALSLSVRGGRELLQKAMPTTLGLRFPEIRERGQKEEYGFDLYQGAAGVGITLLDLFRAAGDPAFARLARGVAYDLIETTPRSPHLRPGLYVGHAGVALFQLFAASILKDPICLSEAIRLAEALAETPFQGTELLSGAAGTGLFFLSFHHATQDQRYLDAARRAIHYLQETAEQEGDALLWAPLVPGWGSEEHRYTPYTGLAHGVAGICLFLAEMFRATSDELARRLLDSGLRWLEKKAVPCGDGISWPVSLADPKLRYHWCHGSTGIAQAYLAVYWATGDREALAKAEEAAAATASLLHVQPQEPLYHCHGLAGIMELFLDLEAASAGGKWREAAVALIPRYADAAGLGEDACDFGIRGTSLATGTAGVVRMLLRMAGKPTLPIHVQGMEELGLPRAGDIEVTLRASPRAGRPARPIAGRTRRLPISWEHGEREWLPRVGTKLVDQDLWVVLGSPAPSFAKAFRARAGTECFFQSLERLRRASAKLEQRHASVLRAGALNNPVVHGPFLRELAGISLQPPRDGFDPRAVVGKLTAQYASMLDLLLARLSKDLDGPLASDVQGRVRNIEVLQSDPHRRGQRVVALGFEDGSGWVYKGRGMAMERYLVGASRAGEPPSLAEKVNRWIVPAVPGAGLRTHRIVQGGQHHGYAERIRTRLEAVEHITHAELDGVPGSKGVFPLRATRLRKGETRRFWYSAGLLAGYAVALGLSDLHSENVLCGRSASSRALGLHAVDLEVGFQELDCLADTMLVDLIPMEHPELHAKGVHRHAGLGHEKWLCACPSEPWCLLTSEEGLRLAPGLRSIKALELPHLVQNPNGSWGYGGYLCLMLRGLIDAWETLRDHAEEAASHLREHLSGAPGRVLLKATQEYNLWLKRRRSGAYPLPGASWTLEYAWAKALAREEMKQLGEFDVPYFFEFLGKGKRRASAIRWLEHGCDSRGRAAEVKVSYPAHDPFWRILERQTKTEVLARSLADAAAYVAPEKSFDWRDDALGVRVFRPQDDSKLWIVALLRDKRLTCRVDGEGAVAMWVD